MLQFVIFAVTVIIVLIVAVIFLLPGSKKVTTVPGPEPVDVLEGNFPDIQSAGSLHEFLMDLHQTYGPIASLWWGPTLTVSIASQELFEQHSKVFDRPECIFELFKPVFGEDSIQFTNGGEGRRRHAAYSKCLSSKETSHYFKLFNKLCSELITKLSSLPKDDHIPLRQYMFAYSIKTVLQALFGSYFNNDKVVYKLRQAYDFVWSELESRVHGHITEASRENLNRFDQRVVLECFKQKYVYIDKMSIKTKLYIKYTLEYSNNKAVMEKFVKEALEYRRSHDDDRQLFVDCLLEFDDPDIEMCDAMTVLVSGIHTSGYVLTWALYFLASHQDVQEKVFQEVDLVLGEKDVDPENYKDLRYVRQVIDETLRCSVLAPYAARVQDIDTELGGHRIPAGTPVIHALGVVFKDPEIYPDPDRFDPDRFSDDQGMTRAPLAFKPFGFAGGRQCPGHQFSLAECTVLIAAIIRSFKVKLIEGQVVIPEHGLVTKPKEEIWISVCKRK